MFGGLIRCPKCGDPNWNGGECFAPPVVDQRVPASERRRLGGMSLRVLDRIRAGPVTNRELAEMFPPGAAWRTRISDARRWVEKNEGKTIRSEVKPGGLCLYWLEEVR